MEFRTTIFGFLCVALLCTGPARGLERTSESWRAYPASAEGAAKESIQLSLPANRYESLFVDLPSNVSRITVRTLNANGNVDLLLRRGVPHDANSTQGVIDQSDAVAITASGNETIQIGRSNGLRPGRWWITPANGTAATVNFTLDLQVEVSGAAFTLVPGMSGSWFDPDKAFQGFFFQMLNSSAALMTWFTYEPDGGQAYFIGVGQVSGDRVEITELIKTRGTRFGTDFDPAQVLRIDWGDLVFTFESCGAGYASFMPGENATSDWWPEQLDIVRLTSIDGLGCNASATASATTLHGGMSGHWYDPARSGEGWMVEVLNATTAFVYWFSYDTEGNQAWFGNIGQIVGSSIFIGDAIRPVGGRFGPNYNPADVSLSPWGAYALTFTSCDTAVAYAVGLSPFGEIGYANIDRLTALAGIDRCDFPSGPHALSSAAKAVAGLVADGDVNDPGAPLIPNNDPANVQPMPNPSAVSGFATAAPTGHSGDRFQSIADPFDAYRVTMAQGQIARLAIADWSATLPAATDLDLLMFQQGTNTLIDASEGSGPVEFVQAPASGTYDIVVSAFAGRSNYVLVVDSGNAGLNAAQKMSPVAEAVPDQLILGFHAPVAGEAKALLTDLSQSGALSHQSGSADGPTLWRVDRARMMKTLGMPSPAKTLGPWAPDDPDVRARQELIHIAKRLSATRSEVRYAELNGAAELLAVPADPLYPYQRWHYEIIKMPSAWSISIGNPNTVVAVIDSGVSPHPDLVGNLDTSLSFDAISDPYRAADGGGIDFDARDPGDFRASAPSFHGTHVAGTIGAQAGNALGGVGVAPDVRLMAVRALNDASGSAAGLQYDITQSIAWAVGLANDSGSSPPDRADVINMSLRESLHGVSCTQSRKDQIAAARARGTVIVAAAGNDRGSVVQNSPANCPGVISVSAVDLRGWQLAPYSTSGPMTDVAAPGGNTELFPDRSGGILSTVFLGAGGSGGPSFDFSQGTSMAAPHVAGVIALMTSVNPNLTPQQVDDLLASGQMTVRPPGAPVPGRDDQFGHGLIDAVKAVDAARRLASTQTPPPLLTADNTSLDFAETQTALRFTLRNAGGGSLSVSGVSSSETWLSAVPISVDAQNLGIWEARVNRNGLVPANYSGRLTFASNGGELRVNASHRVGAAPTTGQAGRVVVLLLDALTLQVVAANASTGSNGRHAFAFDTVLPGGYYLLAGTDHDNDLTICDPGELCGAFPNLTEFGLIEVTTTSRVIGDFALLPDTRGLSGEGASAAPTLEAKRGLSTHPLADPQRLLDGVRVDTSPH